MSQIAENLAAVQDRINAAAQRAGRTPPEITLVAVTKTHPLETVIEAYQAGLRHFGENRAPEAQEKSAALTNWLAEQGQAAVQWHFIGHIQSRQAAEVLAANYRLLHSVDSLKLAQRLNRLARRDDLPPVNVLLQCNVSGEESKFGFNLDNWPQDDRQLRQFVADIEQMGRLEKINVQGLMTMAPWYDQPEKARPVFRRLAALRNVLQAEAPAFTWAHLSMGMTDDFEVAVEEGATIIRVGRAIFGERTYT